jgi:hypothetical protein
MAEIIRMVAVAAKAWDGLVAAVLVSVGGMLVIGGGIYRVFVRPEWSFAQALDTLWPYFLAGFVSLMLGLLVDRAEC